MRLLKLSAACIYRYAFVLILASVGLSGVTVAAPHVQEQPSPIQIILKGVNGAPKKNILATLNSRKNQLTPEENAVREWMSQAPQMIRQALQPFGYFQPLIQSRLEKKHQEYRLVFKIDLGPRVHVTRVDIQVKGPGKKNPKIQKAVQAFSVHNNEPLETKKYTTGRNQLLAAAEEAGYIKATLPEHVIRLNLDNNTAEVHIVLDTGPQYEFGEISFSENPFDKKFLKRFVPFKTGEPYAYTQLLSLQDNLSSSGYFDQVSIQGEPNNAGGKAVPLLVKLSPRKRQRYSLGVGYGTDTGARASLGWDWRWVNRWGHHVLAVLSASQVQRSVITRYSIPGENPLTDQFNITSGWKQLLLHKGSSYTYQLALSQLRKFGDWQRTLDLSYQLDRSKLHSEQTSKRTRYLIPSASWQLLRGDRPFLPTSGYRLNFSIRTAGEDFLSDTSFIQGEVSGKYVHNLSSIHRLLLGGRFGYTASTDMKDLPLSLRFFTGGARSLRGYSYQSLGPGRFVTEANIELQRRLYKKWWVNGFFDAGNASNDFMPMPKAGIGAGLVWQAPIGPIKLMYARPLDARKKSYRIQFTMGPEL